MVPGLRKASWQLVVRLASLAAGPLRRNGKPPQDGEPHAQAAHGCTRELCFGEMNMSEEEKSERPASDPFAQMIQFYDAMSKSWAKAMSDAVSSESFARSMGEQMEGSLEIAALMR